MKRRISPIACLICSALIATSATFASEAQGQLQTWCFPGADLCYSLLAAQAEWSPYFYEGADPSDGTLFQWSLSWTVTGQFFGSFAVQEPFQFSFGGGDELGTSVGYNGSIGSELTTQWSNSRSEGGDPDDPPPPIPDPTPLNWMQIEESGRQTFCFIVNDGTWSDDEACRAVSVPEPSTYLLMLTGIMGLGFVAWRRRGVEF